MAITPLAGVFQTPDGVAHALIGSVSKPESNNNANARMQTPTTFQIKTYDNGGAIYEDAPPVNFSVE